MFFGCFQFFHGVMSRGGDFRFVEGMFLLDGGFCWGCGGLYVLLMFMAVCCCVVFWGNV